MSNRWKFPVLLAAREKRAIRSVAKKKKLSHSAFVRMCAMCAVGDMNTFNREPGTYSAKRDVPRSKRVYVFFSKKEKTQVADVAERLGYESIGDFIARSTLWHCDAKNWR